MLQFAGPIVNCVIVNAAGFVAHSNLGLLWVTLFLHLCGTIACVHALVPLCKSAKASECIWSMCAGGHSDRLTRRG